ncbi:MAG: type II toxin-antitoxin system ParD family antitoxin [Rivularia sp. (in: cyanobacteria)]
MFIQAQMASGRFNNADDVIDEAFKLLEERQRRLEELRQKIAVGTEQIEQGRVTDGEIVFERLQEKILNGEARIAENVIKLLEG